MEVTCNKLYNKIQDDASLKELCKYPFNAALWLKWFTQYKQQRHMDAIRSLRKYVIQDTLNICKLNNLQYKVNGEKVILVPSVDIIRQSACQTTLFDDCSKKKIKGMNHAFQTQLSVVNKDCLEAAIDLVNTGYNPVVLNNASFKRPGGGYLEGSGAQEENIFRRSTYFHSLVDPEKLDKNRIWKYPIPEFGGIYSPHVTVFRESEQKGYAYMPKSITLSFIAVPAYVRPQITLIDKKRKLYHLTDKFADKTKQKIRTILRIALLKGHDSVVLGAFGCGAYMNPPEHVSLLFDQVLFEEDEFIGAFRHVTFAIIEDENSERRMHNPNGNFKPFQTTFTKRQLQLQLANSTTTNTTNTPTSTTTTAALGDNDDSDNVIS